MRSRQPPPAPQRDPDESLMARYVAGDCAAFDALFQRYETRAFAYFAKRTRCQDRALDLYQELFLRIHRMRHSYDARRPFAPWFFQIAHHLLIDDARRAYRSHEVAFDGSPRSASFTVESDEIADHEQLSHLLAGLSEAEREILIAAKLEGVGYAELAVQQGKTVVAVKKMVSRALQRVRCNALVEAAAGLASSG